MTIPITTIAVNLADAGLRMYGGHSALIEFAQHPLDVLAGHTAAKKLEESWEHLRKWSQTNTPPENEDLARAVTRSAILADLLCLGDGLPQAIAGGITPFSGSASQFRNLAEVPHGIFTQAELASIRAAIQSCEQRLKALDSENCFGAEIEPSRLMSEPLASAYGEWLTRSALAAIERVHAIPERVRAIFIERWFGYLCLSFHEEIKTNDRVRRIFTSMQIAMGFIGVEQVAQELERLIRDESQRTRKEAGDHQKETLASLHQIVESLRPVSVSDQANQLLDIVRRPWNPARSPVGSLLRADSAAVPFHGRDSEWLDLAAWCNNDAPVAVRLYTAAGGMGKTRLFFEVCERMRSQGWRAGFLLADVEHISMAPYSALVTQPSPVMIVIDYAESRRAEVVRLLLAVSGTNSGRVRIVLLARAFGDWWETLKREQAGVGNLLAGPATRAFELRTLATTERDRLKSYWIAAKAFGDALERPLPPCAPGDVMAPHFERVLLLQMSALAAIEGVDVKGDQGILNYVLDRERRFWSKQIQAMGLSPLLEDAMAQAMAIITLGGGARDAKHARVILREVPLLKDQSEIVRRRLLTILHDAYPGRRFIEPIMPDLLGEHLVQVVLGKDDGTLLELVMASVDTQSP